MGETSIPLGFRFRPSDLELILYLVFKAKGLRLPCDGFIKEIDLYKIEDPCVLFEGTRESVVYVFTRVKKMVKNGTRIERRVPENGTWKGTDGSKPIIDKRRRRCLGHARNFTFENDLKVKLGYNMKEVVLDDSILCHAKFKDYVICEIKNICKEEGNPRDHDNLQEGICMPITTIDYSSSGHLVPYSEGYEVEENSTIIRSSQSDQEQLAQIGYEFQEGICTPITTMELSSSGHLVPYYEGYEVQENSSIIGFAQSDHEQVAEIGYEFQEGSSCLIPVANADYDNNISMAFPSVDISNVNNTMLIDSVPLLPLLLANQDQQDSWMATYMSTFAQSQEEQAEQCSKYRDLDLIKELVTVPPYNWFSENNAIYPSSSALASTVNMELPAPADIMPLAKSQPINCEQPKEYCTPTVHNEEQSGPHVLQNIQTDGQRYKDFGNSLAQMLSCGQDGDFYEKESMLLDNKWGLENLSDCQMKIQ